MIDSKLKGGDIMKAQDISKIIEKHRNKWIVLSKDKKRVLATAQTPQGAFKKLSNLGEEAVVYKAASESSYSYF